LNGCKLVSFQIRGQIPFSLNHRRMQRMRKHTLIRPARLIGQPELCFLPNRKWPPSIAGHGIKPSANT
jgi:hypothetical protein